MFAGGNAGADATSFTLSARKDGGNHTIGENQYLGANASSVSDDVTISIGDGTWSYEETTMLRMNEFPEPYARTDRNTLRRVG